LFPIERTLRQGVISIEITFVRGSPPALLHIKHYVRDSSAAMFPMRTLRQGLNSSLFLTERTSGDHRQPCSPSREPYARRSSALR
jgi:hypothetical protein